MKRIASILFSSIAKKACSRSRWIKRDRLPTCGELSARKASVLGFTLLEVLVAFAIMAISLGMLYRAIGSGAKSAGDVDHYQRAVVLAESLLSMRDTVTKQGWNEEGQSANFVWRISSAPFATTVTNPAAPTLHEVVITVTWGGSPANRQYQITTLVPERRPVPGEEGRL